MCFSFPALSPLVLSKCLPEHVIGQLRLLTLLAACCMEMPWLPIILSMLEDITGLCPIEKAWC